MISCGAICVLRRVEATEASGAVLTRFLAGAEAHVRLGSRGWGVGPASALQLSCDAGRMVAAADLPRDASLGREG